ncbi:hypothetical protein SAMN05421858_5069 [Haladaptatus litoreus]|uniref:Uncharacterized protein n=1 Tax=Haladaptatus litoreus TaxID=553468 RepID=A0A1N7FHS1_9EURY|nr:hypothetical protein [Haladaptatus litoreus]SIR99834.1 hypothetical protein SAMN05421858_5069 [Haladaptatus litoreus]
MPRRNIKLPADDYAKHNERRQEMGRTWAEYIDGQAPELENVLREIVREEIERANEEQVREIANELQSRF